VVGAGLAVLGAEDGGALVLSESREAGRERERRETKGVLRWKENTSFPTPDL
jgi:hypothetical protein